MKYSRVYLNLIKEERKELPDDHQIYGKLKVVSMDAEGNIDIWIEKESRVPINVLLLLNEEFKGKDILVTIQPLIKKEDLVEKNHFGYPTIKKKSSRIAGKNLF